VKPTGCEKEIIASDAVGTLADAELLVDEAVLGTTEAVLAGAEVSDGSEVFRL
jgi:hypothetical protein